jgi:hypothetical protein
VRARVLILILIAPLLAFVALALMCATARRARAAIRPVQVETIVLPDTARLGDVVELRYRMWLPKNARSAFPGQPLDDSLHHWLGWRPETMKTKGDLVEHRLTARFQTYALGLVTVAGLPVRFRIAGEPPRQGQFPIASYVVTPSAPATGPEPPIRGLKALVAPPWWALVPWMWVAVAVALLAIAIWLFLRWRRRRALVRPVSEAEAALDPPHVEARRRLDALVAKRLPEAGRVLEHGVELADLLHRFVERRFGSLEPGHTTSELARKLAARPDVDAADVVTLRGILEACDLTKFARRPYDAARAHEAEAQARALIDAWTERPAAAHAAPGTAASPASVAPPSPPPAAAAGGS